MIIPTEEVEKEIRDCKFYINLLKKKYHDFKIVYYSHKKINNLSVYLIVSSKGDIVFSHIFYHSLCTRRFDFPNIELNDDDKDLYLAKVDFKLSSVKNLIDKRLRMKYENKKMKENDKH